MLKSLRLMMSASVFLGLSGGSALAAGCDIEDFPTFMREFARSVAVQEGATADPLILRSLEEGDPEPVAQSKEVPLSDVEWPVIGTLSGLEAQGHELIWHKDSADQESLQVRGGDNGLNIRYVFRRAPCWTLTEIDNASL